MKFKPSLLSILLTLTVVAGIGAALGPYGVQVNIPLDGDATHFVNGAGALSTPSGTNATLWSSSNGQLAPSPAVNFVNVTSQLANNSTNIALIVDTLNAWTNKSKLLQLNNQGSNSFSVSSDGSLSIGRSTSRLWGDVTASPLTAVYDRAVGDPSLIQFYIENIRDGSTWKDSAYIGATLTTNSSLFFVTCQSNLIPSTIEFEAAASGNLYIRGEYINLLRFYLEPTIAPTVAPYMFDTAVAHTSGNLLEVKNNGTNKVTVGWDGAVGGIHLKGISGTPTISTNSGSGVSGASATITGKDLAGEVTINSGVTPVVNAAIVTVTFNVAYSTAPYVVLWPSSATASVLGFLPYVTSTTTNFVINNAVALGLAASTTYKYNYLAVQ